MLRALGTQLLDGNDAACKLVIADYSGEQEGLPPRAYVDDMSQLIERWLDNPSKDNMELVRSALDVTRSAHAWQRDKDVEASWILEAVDHASLAVWAGDRSSYIIPLDFATCAARAVACVLHAMLDAKVPEDKAVSDIVEAITISTV